MNLEQLSLKHSLGISSPAVVSFFGAGGKTTLMLRLASEILKSGQKVLLTTTTKIYIPPDLTLITAENVSRAVSLLKKHYRNSNIAVLGGGILSDGKIKGIEATDLEILRKELPVSILVEADGARGKPIKAYKPGEPLLPCVSDKIIAVIGADALGAPLSPEVVHRCEEYIEVTGNRKYSSITEAMIADVYLNLLNLGQKQAPEAVPVLILNKADLLENREQSILKLVSILSEKGFSGELLITQANSANSVKYRLQPTAGSRPFKVACIILAAGTSSRMGTDKLFLPLRGKTILEHTVSNVSEAGFNEIIVVTKPGLNWKTILDQYNCRITENVYFESGLASSLKTGLQEVGSNIQGILFALGDQPMVQPDLYRLLCEKYYNNLKLITCPVYNETRGNPVIFDRRVWPELINLSGDQGGRAIISNIAADKIDHVKTDSDAVTRDVDTKEDYQTILNS